MSGRSGDEFNPLVVEVSDSTDANADDDAIGPATNRRGWWRVPRNSYLIAAALVIVAVIAAYQLDGHSTKTAPGPSSSPVPNSSASFAPVAPAVPIAETGAQCAVQVGPEQLQLGFEIANRSARPVTLMNLSSALPLGGLTEIAQAQGACGQLQRTGPIAGVQLAAGATTWLSVTFTVAVACPTPNPVKFTLVVAQASNGMTIRLSGFADLAGVTYSGCTGS